MAEELDDFDRNLDAEGAEKREETRTDLEHRAVELRNEAEDKPLKDRLDKLGFGGETAKMFDLVPMVHVAWADGEIQKRERNSIMAVVHARGVQPGSESHTLMMSLLEKRPGDAFIDETLDALKLLVADKDWHAKAIVDCCVAVAEAHGRTLGIFGNPIDDSERAMLQRIADAMGDKATAWMKEKLG